MQHPRPLLRMILALVLLPLSARAVEPPAPYGPVPTPAQLAWQDMEQIALIHFGPNTFTTQEWGYGDTPPETFNPTDLDTDQWVRAAAAAGIKGLILVAKHHDGFCLWPTRTTDYSVAASPWKDGKGDLVADFFASCERAGMAYGLYLSPWDRNHADYGADAYVRDFHAQWRELLERHPGVFEVWFDGANGGSGYYGGARETRRIPKDYYQYETLFTMISSIAPQTVFFEGAGYHVNAVRWPGNETGWIHPDQHWATFPNNRVTRVSFNGRNTGFPPGGTVTLWVPAEANTTLHSPKRWFFNEKVGVRTPANLLELYYTSVGRGANLNLGLSPDKRGRLPDSHVESLAAWGRLLAEEFKLEFARGARLSADSVRGGDPQYDPAALLDGDPATYWATDDGIRKGMIEITLPEATLVNCIELREPIHLGQRITTYKLEGETETGWRVLTQSGTVGRRCLRRFPGTQVRRLRLTLETEAPCLALSELRIHRTPVRLEEPSFHWDRAGFLDLSAAPGSQLFFALGDTPAPEDFQRHDTRIPLPRGGDVHAYAVDPVSGERSGVVSERFGLPTHRWNIVATSAPESRGFLPLQLIDGHPDRMWRTFDARTPLPPPQWFEIDLGDELDIAGFICVPRQDGRREGVVDRYRLEVRDADGEWTVAAEGEFDNILNNPERQEVLFARPLRTRHIRFTALHALPNNRYVSVAEFGLIAPRLPPQAHREPAEPGKEKGHPKTPRITKVFTFNYAEDGEDYN